MAAGICTDACYSVFGNFCVKTVSSFILSQLCYGDNVFLLQLTLPVNQSTVCGGRFVNSGQLNERSHGGDQSATIILLSSY